MSEEELSTCSLESPPVEVKIASPLGKKSIKQNCDICSKPSYRMRKVKNKGAVLVITWSYLVISIYFYVRYTASREYNSLLYHILQAIAGFTLPLAGWLADVRFGRYKVLSCSLWTMWISALLLTVKLLLTELNIQIKHEWIISTAILTVLVIGFGGFQSNVIQFGIDQLIDASSTEFKAFVAWYTWTYIVGNVVLYFILTCVETKLAAPLMICCNLTIALTLNLVFKNVLIKEPTTQNPFKLVYRVVTYAFKHTSIHDKEVLSHTVKTPFPLA